MMPESAPTIRDEALAYYDSYKWFVLPTDPGAKKPYYGFRWKPYGEKLPPREEVDTWPEWNKDGVRLGTRTGAVSGIIVVDVDSQEAHEYLKEHGHSIGPMVQSPREGGGLHLYYEHPGFYVKSTVALGGIEGLDIRGDMGIVVLPPSPDHKTGRSYEWIIPPSDVAIPPAPPWLLDLLKKQSTAKERLDIPRIMAGVPEGQRDSTLNRLAGKFRYMNLPEDVAGPMIELAAERCSPSFNKAEARAKVKWAYTHYEPGEDVPPALKTRMEDKEEDQLEFSAESLMAEEFPPVKWIIPGLLPEGSMIFAGKPKMGKSWMALGFCIAVATGGKALEEFDCETGDVLYMALEDNKRRLQSRMKELLQSNSRGSEDLSRLTMKVRAKKLDGGDGGLLEELEGWLEEHPGARMIVIDTLGSVRGKSSDRRTLYEQDYEIGAALTKLAGEYAVCILIVHHLRKGDAEDPMDMISGSTGLTGGMDGAMVLNRTRSAADGILKAVHRDLEDDPEIALQKVEASSGWWKYAGDAEEYRMGKERKEIFDTIANAEGPIRPQEVAEALGKGSENIRKLMQLMREDGLIDNEGYGKYVVATGPAVPPTLTNPLHSIHSVHSSTSTLDTTVNTVNGVNGVPDNEEGELF